MLEKREIITIVISLFIGFSAILSAVSTEYDAKAEKELLFSLIEFEKANYISENQIVSLSLMNADSLNENKEFVMRSWICSFALVYKDTISPDQELLADIAEQCLLDLNKVEDSKNLQSYGMNQSLQLSEMYKSIKPFEELTNNLQKYFDYSKISRYTKYVSWILFVMGFLIFYYYFLQSIFIRRLR